MEAQKAMLVCAVLYFLAACAEAAVPLRSRTICVDAETQKSHSLGETWYTTGERGCMKLTCEGEDTISGLTCALFQVPSWCSVKPGNPKAMYPNCCPSPVCPEENAIEDSSAEISAIPADLIASPSSEFVAEVEALAEAVTVTDTPSEAQQ